MNIDDLCEMDSSQLEALTDEQLMVIFKPFLSVTRPELARANRTNAKTVNSKLPPIVMTEAKQKALAMLSESGVDMSFLNRMRKVKRS